MSNIEVIKAKLVAAQNCHPNAVQALIEEALGALDEVARTTPPAQQAQPTECRNCGGDGKFQMYGPAWDCRACNGTGKQAQAEAVPTVTPAMVDAYLKANTAYWQQQDELPKPPAKWINGTPQEATRVSLIAALAAAPQQIGGA